MLLTKYRRSSFACCCSFAVADFTLQYTPNFFCCRFVKVAKCSQLKQINYADGYLLEILCSQFRQRLGCLVLYGLFKASSKFQVCVWFHFRRVLKVT